VKASSGSSSCDSLKYAIKGSTLQRIPAHAGSIPTAMKAFDWSSNVAEVNVKSFKHQRAEGISICLASFRTAGLFDRVNLVFFSL
jgi:hypothetical protein